MDAPFPIQENVGLAELTTLQIGGPARYFVRATDAAVVPKLLEWADAFRMPVMVLGGGSNVVISDSGFDGLVVQIAIGGITVGGTGPHVQVTAGAGEDWDGFVDFCVQADLAGLECLSGIPGFVGGTPIQNVGAYGQEVSETIVSVDCYDREAGAFVTLRNSECGFAYRTSIFNTHSRDRYIVLAVTFELSTGGPPKVVYKDLVEHFGSAAPELRSVREAVLAIRRAKSMVIDPADPNSRSAGSFFKNPIVDSALLDEIRRRDGSDPPHFQFGDRFKVPAAWLIEHSGFPKGFKQGNVGISENHTLALINRGGATATELMELRTSIQDAVDQKFGIKLEQEPVLVGF